jgi:hypothetical protein
MVDSRGPLGGVCLNVGCIPSKALLHAVKVIAETKEMDGHGLSFVAPTIDLDALRSWKDGVVARLTGGMAGLAKQRKVTTIVGTGTFTGSNMLSVAAPDGSTLTVCFDAAIIAAGSEPVALVTPVPARGDRAGRGARRRCRPEPDVVGVSPHALARLAGPGQRSMRQRGGQTEGDDAALDRRDLRNERNRASRVRATCDFWARPTPLWARPRKAGRFAGSPWCQSRL